MLWYSQIKVTVLMIFLKVKWKIKKANKDCSFWLNKKISKQNKRYHIWFWNEGKMYYKMEVISQNHANAAGVWEPRAYLFFPLHLYRFQRRFADVSDVGSRLGGSEGGLGSVWFGHREQVRLGDVGVGPRLRCGVVTIGQLGPLILFNHLHILSICLKQPWVKLNFPFSFHPSIFICIVRLHEQLEHTHDNNE